MHGRSAPGSVCKSESTMICNEHAVALEGRADQRSNTTLIKDKISPTPPPPSQAVRKRDELAVALQGCADQQSNHTLEKKQNLTRRAHVLQVVRKCDELAVALQVCTALLESSISLLQLRPNVLVGGAWLAVPVAFMC